MSTTSPPGRPLAIVTGGAAGLGRLISEELCQRAIHVLIADRDANAGEQAIDDLAASPGGATFVETNLSDPDQLDRVVDVTAQLGGLSVLVNNAGGWSPDTQYPQSETWRRTIDLNLITPMLATQRCLPLLQATGGGAVINVSSSGGWETSAYGSPEYGAAKAGLIRFTTAVSDFGPRFGVRVSCVVPHWIGLDRAVTQFQALSPEDQERSGGLIDPPVVVQAIVDLIDDPDSAGQVMIIRPDRPPYRVDAAGLGHADPFASAPSSTSHR